MQTTKTQKISAVIPSDKKLERVITKLMSESVARADISVQGTPEEIKEKYGVSFIDPELIQDSAYPPTKEPFLNDDFGWVVGFSFAIPFFICLVVAIFIIGDIRSLSDNILFAILGGIVGTAIGLSIAILVKKNHDKKLAQQESKGGFVIWVTTHSDEQYRQVIRILKRYRPENMKI